MNQLTLDDFALFAEIAAAKSLSTVARQRNVAASHVSRALARIERECALRLVRRTTNSLSLTDEGEVFLEHAQRMLAQRDQLQDRLSTRKKSVSGIVRISVAALFAEYVVAPQLARLNDIHPELELDLQVSDEMVNLAHAKVDIAIRAGIMPADNMIARKLGHHGRALFAAPGYLKKHGAPNQPDDLKAHRLITNSTTPSHNEWRFLIDGKQHSYTMQGQLRVNNSAAVMSLALAGAGIARVNDVLGRNFVRQGKLKPVLANYCIPGEYPVFAAILAERYRAPKIRATMDYLKGCFAAFAPAPK